ncbi:MAG: idi [Candidatus Saccharibacteria bacterium]|nr:idi [Candidatus Saccharibacteria bacterium]
MYNEFTMSELIVLVNDAGQPIGTADKLEAHHADTPLHLAFSCYVFNQDGKILVTQRAITKKVWPGVWTNSVCGHPGPGEDIVSAIQRRLHEELGMTAEAYQVVLPTYRYKTPPFNGIIENEICPVYVARATSEPKANPAEVEAHNWEDWHDFVASAARDASNAYSWWCKDQLKQLKEQPLIHLYSGSAL